MKEVTMFCSGICLKSPVGPGGYGIVLVHGEHRKELSGGVNGITHDRIELLACIRGLEALKEPCNVTIMCVSRTIVNAITLGWIDRWKDEDWKRQGKPVENRDLWERLQRLCNTHKVKMAWTPGRSGHYDEERSAELASHAANETKLPADTVPVEPEKPITLF